MAVPAWSTVWAVCRVELAWSCPAALPTAAALLFPTPLFSELSPQPCECRDCRQKPPPRQNQGTRTRGHTHRDGLARVGITKLTLP